MKPRHDDPVTPAVERLTRDYQDTVLAPGRGALRRELLSHASAPSTARWRWAAGLALAGCVAAVVTVVATRPPPPMTANLEGVTTPVGERIATPADRSMQLRFSEGTSIELGAASSVALERLDADGASVRLSNGQLEAHVVHREKTRWEVRAGPYVVHVTGTVFRVRWDEARRSLWVRLAQGHVVVDGPNLDARALGAGEVLEVTEPVATPVDSGAALPIDEPQAPVADAGPSPKPVLPARHAIDDTSWEKAARQRQWSHALALARQGGTTRLTEKLDAERLLLLTDAARFGGDTDLAVSVLEALRRRFGGHAEATEAAYVLGRIAVDQRHDLVRASAWFLAAYREAPSGPLAEESLARAMELEASRGATGPAASLAAEYAAHFPVGPHVARARALGGGAPK